MMSAAELCSSDGNFNSETMNHLISLLSLLTARKSSSFTQYWDNGMLEDPPSKTSLEATYTTLRELKRVQNALQGALDATENAIFNLQEKCLPLTLHHGIQSILNDTLQQIFTIACERSDDDFDDAWRPSFPITLSHVNRHFRSLALQAPRIWGNLSSALTSEQLSGFIIRSKSANLNLFMDIIEGSTEASRLECFLDTVIKHCDRWSQLRYDHCSLYEDIGHTHPAFLKCLKRPLILPRLTSLTYKKYDFTINEGDVENGDYLMNWEMPKLLRFNGRNTLADAEFKNVGTNLAICSLDFQDTSGGYSRDFRGCLKALESFPQLKTLVWKLSDTRECDNVIPSHKTSLRHLVSFQIELGGNTVCDIFLKRMFKTMEMPILSSMTVIVRDSFGHAGMLPELILNAALCWPNLRTFVMDVPSVTFNRNFLVCLATARPSLTEVTLRGRGYCFGYTECDTFPSWRSLRLEGFSREDQKGIIGVIGLVAGGPHSEFRLHIADCIVEHHFIAKLRRLLGNKLVHEN